MIGNCLGATKFLGIFNELCVVRHRNVMHITLHGVESAVLPHIWTWLKCNLFCWNMQSNMYRTYVQYLIWNLIEIEKSWQGFCSRETHSKSSPFSLFLFCLYQGYWMICRVRMCYLLMSTTAFEEVCLRLELDKCSS